MSASTAINVFASAVVREKRIPFEICAPEVVTREGAMNAFLALRAEAKRNGVSDMTTEEINREIQAALAEQESKA